MKAIKIDVVKKEVYEVEISSDIKTMHKQLECSCFAAAGHLKNKDMLLVDDEGLLVEKPLGFFIISGYPNLLSGHGLVVGVSRSGATVPAKSTADGIKQMVEFIDP
jgi:hypothetical protein